MDGRNIGKRWAAGLTALLWTTLAMQAQTDTTAFMRQLLQAPHVTGVEACDGGGVYKEKYVVRMTQDVNGHDTLDGTFSERVVVGLKGPDRPTVMVTEGYFAHYALNPLYEEELSRLLDANVVVCEHRYFAESVPQTHSGGSPSDEGWDYWQWMTVDNSMADLHRVRQSLGTVFGGKWVATGISKGGQTTMFYRATYPDDVDVSVSYVAPLNRRVEDGRHEPFLDHKVGTAVARLAVRQAQCELLWRKERLLPGFDSFSRQKGYTYNLPVADIYDYCVLELPFAFWQWGTPVSTIPQTEAADSTWLDYLTTVAGPDYFTCPSAFTPFHVQAARELGYYGYSRKGLRRLLGVKRTKGYLKQIMLPQQLRGIKFDKTLYKRTVKFLKTHDPKHIFIYGEYDPWSASGVADWLDCSRKQNMRVYVQPGGSHATRISTMPDDMKTEILSRLTDWLEK